MIYSEDKIKTHSLVAKAIKEGKLIKPTECSRCGKEGWVEGHHKDYSKPLEVEWLCRKCHRGIHAKNPWYLNLPSVKDIYEESRIDRYILEDYYEDCTYSMSRKFDIRRNCNKITVKFYDNRGFVVWKEQYYSN